MLTFILLLQSSKVRKGSHAILKNFTFASDFDSLFRKFRNKWQKTLKDRT